ncbi:hypothetical protein JQ614_02485 [Bradyrhizobium diazoefficiens]|uniref:hypothetical protein n=1 Tax=Bradyrhizobium diazoefficiens TaxID=1355477 RepID=UPI001B8AE6AE|nr:hypothetical protein [Bradyrhizobium diazoefficiens]MBR0860664.1 hypothetical protein [Bradyrhizobium diazoefficiens]MBR0885155.1 hypothetical protein [Bradyrhizobium diazoefficiens]MBR0917059.1 hypothetical protein [Bradyrhizobium diazoefficiens]
MGLQLPLIHCNVDPEPTAYHTSDLAKSTVSFAINLSLECPSDGSGDVAGDEILAEAVFESFLQKVQSVELHVWKVDVDPKGKITFTYDPGKLVKQVSETTLGAWGDLRDWLQGGAPKNPKTRYWSTDDSGNPGIEVAIDVKSAGASHRLRAAQSFNAPVAHKFGLTHIVRLDVSVQGAPPLKHRPARPADQNPHTQYLVLPYFGPPGSTPALPTTQYTYSKPYVWDLEYDALGDMGGIHCRTGLLGKDMPLQPLDPAKIDDAFTSEGYLLVDPDAENLRRVTRWFEDRAASLMSAGSALALQVAVKDESQDPYSRIFRTTGDVPSHAAAWYATAALCSALDPLLIGILKPVSGLDSEGEILSPLVSVLLETIKSGVTGKFTLDDDAFKARTVTAALRAAIAATPLGQNNPSRAALATELRYVHDIKSTPDSTVGAKLLNALLDYYAKQSWTPPTDDAAKAAVSNLGPTLLASAVAEFVQKLHDQAGVEAAIVRLLETSSNKLSARIAASYLLQIGQSGNSQLLAVIMTAVDAAWSSYCKLLTGPFNGAEAMRRAAGSEFTKAALRAMKSPATQTSSRQFCELIEKSQFYAARFLHRGKAAGCFDDIVLSLPIPLADLDREIVQAHLDAAFAVTMKPLALSLKIAAGFIPDSTPQPLPIQIAANIDGAQLDEFGKHFNGFAVAVRRIDTGDDTKDLWAHANLAELTWDTADPPQDSNKIVQAAIHPMLPAVSDGRGPMFIEYQGFPFADSTFAATMLDQSPQAGAASYRPFYRHYTADYAGSGFALLPGLAYGRTFESFGFLISNGGSVPLASHLADDRPWMPGQQLAEPDAPPHRRAELVAEADYQRRTAICQMVHEETTTRRIGAPIPGVLPLSSDYPRIGLFAESATDGVRDIFREMNGSGSLVIGSLSGAATTRVDQKLADVRWAGSPKRLILGMFDGPGPGPDNRGNDFPFALPTTAADLAKITTVRIQITATRIGGDEDATWAVDALVTCGDQSLRRQFTATNETLWIRLWLETDAQPASMSFGDPSSHKADSVDAPLLLLATPESQGWLDGIATGVTVVIHTPRVGYLDFERWFFNDDLLRLAFDFDAHPGNVTFAKRLHDFLLLAYGMRHKNEELAANLDRLPDPAVDKVRIELTFVDQLIEKTPVGLTTSVDLKGWLLDVASKLPDPSQPPDHKAWTVQQLIDKVFKPLQQKFQFTIGIEAKAGDPSLNLGRDGSVEATLPGGVTAKLSMDALVSEEHFAPKDLHPAVFHHGPLQYVSRRVEGKYLALPSHGIRIETMLDAIAALAPGAIKLAADMIEAVPIDRSRRYDIVTKPELPDTSDAVRTRQWRLLGQIDVATQRWRPTGKPIYHYVDPKAFRYADPKSPRVGGGNSPVIFPALRVDPDSDGVLAGFEAEAFFARLDIDAQTITQTLLPLPSRTVLQQHVWDSPAATYFRHRFTLRSRYAGALKKVDDQQVAAWVTKTWTMRVAMLADLSRILLTRPQLRALIPLTTSPDADQARRPAPPVAAILQEPPFSRGGLADRIAAEVKTGFGYGFEKPPEHGDSTPVEILDSRKEIGPSPFLDYRPLDATAALGTALMGEGPMGLTFDPVDASAPAFPNSMMTLSPVAVAGNDLTMEEYFVGVSMRRYIDPAWTLDYETAPAEILAERCWWIEYALPMGKHDLLTYKTEKMEQTLLMIEEANETFLIKTKKAAVDGVEGAKTQDVTLALLRKDFAASLVVLHQPIAPGRYSTSVLALPKLSDWTATTRGRSNSPLLLANFEWSPPKNGKDRPIAVALVIGDAGKEVKVTVAPTIASAPTAIAWTKTNRDFDFVHTARFDEKAATFDNDTARVTELIAHRTKGQQLTFDRSNEYGPVWLCPSTLLNKYPVHLHRHLALLTTQYMEGPGRPLEFIYRSAVFTGLAAGLVPNGSPTDNRVRIIEFETPASVLCGTEGIPIPDTYKTAYMDLLSTGFTTSADNPSTLRFLFRFVGSPNHLRKFTKLTIVAWTLDLKGQKQEQKWDVDLKNAAKGPFTMGMELLVGTGNSAKTSVSLLRSDGGVSPPEIAPSKLVIDTADNTRPGLFVSITAVDVAAEFWADVSLLHSRAPVGSFDFSWLFSEPGGPDGGTEVTPKALARMVEAQARIVSISPPISIV